MGLLETFWTRLGASIGGGGGVGWPAFFGGVPTTAGVKVDEFVALNYSAVYAAVYFKSSTVGMLPMTLYRRTSATAKEEARDHSLWNIFAHSPNPWMNAYVWRTTMQSHYELWGNAYSEIVRDGAGNVRRLVPVAPNRIQPWLDDSGDIVYRLTGSGEDVPADRIFHLSDLGWNGLLGYAKIYLARESLGLTAAAEKTGAAFLGNGMRPSGTLNHPGRPTEMARKNLRESVDRMHGGPANAGKMMILWEGMTFAPMEVPPEAAQLLQTRQFQLDEVARWFNVPPHILRNLIRSSFSNIAQQGEEVVRYTFLPICTNWEQEVSRKLLRKDERDEYFAEHDFDVLLRGDKEARYRTHATGIQWGFLNRNEVRHEEGLNSIGEDGDVYLVPANMVPADKAGETPASGPGAPPGAPPGGPKIPAQGAAAFRALALDIAGRMVRVECNALRRAAKDPAAFLDWLGDFYAAHERKLAEALAPAARAIHATLGGEHAGESLAFHLAGEHCRRSRCELLDLSGELTPAELREGIEACADVWEEARPGQLADALVPPECYP